MFCLCTGFHRDRILGRMAHGFAHERQACACLPGRCKTCAVHGVQGMRREAWHCMTGQIGRGMLCRVRCMGLAEFFKRQHAQQGRGEGGNLPAAQGACFRAGRGPWGLFKVFAYVRVQQMARGQDRDAHRSQDWPSWQRVQQRACSLAALHEGLLLQKAASAVLQRLAGQVARSYSVSCLAPCSSFCKARRTM